MLKVLAWKEWREQRPVVAAGCGIAAFLPMLMMAAVTVTEQNPGPEDVIDTVPIALFAFVWPLLAAAAGAITIATEVEEGTMRFLLSRPVSRSQVWGVKVGLAVGSLAVIGAFSLLMIWGVNRFSLSPDSTTTFRSIMGSLSSTMYDPFTLASLSFLLFACSVFCSSLLSRPLTAAAAGLAMALGLLAAIFVVWSQLSLVPRLEPQWLGIEVMMVAGAVLLVSMLVFTWAEVFGGPGSSFDAGGDGSDGEGGGLMSRGRMLAGVLAVFAIAIIALPMAFAAANLAFEDARIDPGSVSYAGNNVVMTVGDAAGGSTENWLLHTDGSGILRLTGRHTFGPTFMNGSTIAYLSRRGIAGGRTGGLDLRITDRRGDEDRLIMRNVPAQLPLFFSSASSSFRARSTSVVAFSTGTELTVARTNGHGHSTIDISGTPLEDAYILGFTAGVSQVLLFLPAEAQLTAAGELPVAAPLTAYHVSEGAFRVVRDLPAGTVIPALRNPDGGPGELNDITLPRSARVSGWRWLSMLVPGDDGMELEVLEVVAGEAVTVGRELAGAVTGRRRPVGEPVAVNTDDATAAEAVVATAPDAAALDPCQFAEVPAARSWRRADGRRFRESQVLFVDCAGGPGVTIRLRGLESGDERVFPLPTLAPTERIENVSLARAQDAVLVHIIDAGGGERAAVIERDGAVHEFDEAPLGWIGVGRVLLHSLEGAEPRFAVGDYRLGTVLELYPVNEVAQQGDTRPEAQR